MKVYIATSMSNAGNAILLADLLRIEGHKITSRWHDAEPPAGGENSLTQKVRKEIAQKNFDAIEDSEAMVFLDHPRCRGALVEVGYAFGICQILGFGPREGRSLMAEYCAEWVDGPEGVVAKLAAYEKLAAVADAESIGQS